MPDPSPAQLRLDPGALPALITALDRALGLLSPTLRELLRRGRLDRPWLGDPDSAEVVKWYHWLAMGDGDSQGRSAYARLRAYEAELIKVRDALAASKAEYERVEGDNADLMGGRV